MTTAIRRGGNPPNRCFAITFIYALVSLCRPWEVQCDHPAMARRRHIFGLGAPSLRGHQGMDDGKAQAAAFPGSRAVAAIETMENPVLGTFRKPETVITDHQPSAIRTVSNFEMNGGALGSVALSIVDQIKQDFAQPIRVG